MNLNKLLLSLGILIVIVLSFLGIWKLVVDLEYTLGFLSLSFAILAVIWTTIAKYDLSLGSSLRKYADNFLACALFLLIYSGYSIFRKLFNLVGGFIYIEYILISVAYLVLALAAYRMLRLGKEFGFRVEVKRIKKRIRKKRK